MPDNYNTENLDSFLELKPHLKLKLAAMLFQGLARLCANLNTKSGPPSLAKVIECILIENRICYDSKSPLLYTLLHSVTNVDELRILMIAAFKKSIRQ